VIGFTWRLDWEFPVAPMGLHGVAAITAYGTVSAASGSSPEGPLI
jgi:hypothetical protein